MAYFNPRTPCGVRPRAAGRSSSKDKQFQSTHPVRGATRAVFPARRRPHISIHAPRAGCDHTLPDLVFWSFYFNPRTPCGVRLHFLTSIKARGKISIHAPRAGCDIKDRILPCRSVRFQSTHPVRGATANMYNLVCSYFCNFTKSDVCLLTLYLFYHAISTENVVFSRFSAVRSAPGIHVRSRFAPRQSISSPSGA